MEEKIKALKMGETIDFKKDNDIFTVKYHSNHTYNLKKNNDYSHLKWGTLKEILSDLNYCMIAGKLPPMKGNSWH